MRDSRTFSSRHVVIVMSLLTLSALGAAERLNAPERRLRYVYESATNASLSGEGTLIKRGPGTLVIQRASMFRGALQVEEGSVSIRTGGAATTQPLPVNTTPALTNQLALWLDASKNVIQQDGAVSHWFDVRDLPAPPVGESGVTNYPWARRETGANAPLAATDATGKPCVDFGVRVAGTGGAWLQWTAQDADVWQCTNVYTVVMAVACENGGGSFLGDLQSSDFARGLAAATGGRYLLQHGVSSPSLIQGDAYVDGELVDPLKSCPKSGCQILTFVMRSKNETTLPMVCAANFGRDRDEETGGFRLYEVLIYDRVLNEDERILISQYLDEKWFGRDMAGDLEVAPDTEIGIHTAVDDTLSSRTLLGSGTIVKQGPGVWSIENLDSDFPGQIRLEDGQIDFSAAPARQALPFSITSPLAITATPESVSASTPSTPGVVEKNGTGELLVTALSGIQSLRVADGTLRLAPREQVTAAEEASWSVIFEESFEYPFSKLTYSGQNTGIRFSPGAYGDDWTLWPGLDWCCKVNDPTISTPRNPAIILCEDGYNSGMVTYGGTGHGSQALLLQGKGEIRRIIAIPTDGDYELNFWASARNTAICVNHVFDVCVNGHVVTSIVTGTSSYFRYYQVALTNLTAGALELRFSGTNTLAPEETYRASVLDGIRIVRTVSAVGNAAINDPGFESGPWASGTITAPPYSPWSFPSDSGTAAAIILPSVLAIRGAPEGVRTAWLRNSGNFAATNVVLNETGSYAVSFLAASRHANGDRGDKEGCWPGHDYRVFVNGRACGYARSMTRRFIRHEVICDVETVGAGIIGFSGLNESGLQYFISDAAYNHSRMTLIDCVRLRRVETVAIPNYSFEDTQTVGWQWINNGAITTASGNNYVPLSNLPDGPTSNARAGLILAQGQMFQDIVIPDDGVFRLSFYAAGRFLYASALDPRRTTATARHGHDFRVCVDGQPVLHVQTRDEIFRQYAVRLPLLNAGTHRLSFVGINTLGGTERGTAVDAVRLTRVYTVVDQPPLPEKIEIEVASGARLHLDYQGVIDVKRVRYGGQECQGVISAARYPSFVTGVGSMFVTPKGTAIFIH